MSKMNIGRIVALLFFFYSIWHISLHFYNPSTEYASFMDEANSALMQSLTFGFVVASILLASFPFKYAHRAWKNYQSGSEYGFHRTALPEFQTVPDELKDWETELIRLNFSPLGTYESVHSDNNKLNHKAWVYLDEENITYTEMTLQASGECILQFCTDYPDKFSLNTAFNMLFEVETNLLSFRSLISSISAAYDYHSSQIKVYAKLHGQAKVIQNLHNVFPSPEDNLRMRKSIEFAVFKKFSLMTAGYLSYGLACLISLALVPVFGTYFATIIFCFLLGISLWSFDITSMMQPYKPVESRKPRKTAE